MPLRRWRHLLMATILLPLVVTLGVSARAQQGFPANAVIRGENIQLRAAPAMDAAVRAYLQRGEPVTLTGPVQVADGEAFAPVTVPRLEQSGWVRQLAITAASLVAIAPRPNVDDTAAERRAAPHDRAAAKERTHRRTAPTKPLPTVTVVPTQGLLAAVPTPTAVPSQGLLAALPTATPVPPSAPAPTSVPTRLTVHTPSGPTATCRYGTLRYTATNSSTCSHDRGVAERDT